MGMQAIGEYLRVLREARGLTQIEVARRVEISLKQLGRWEHGQSNPSISALTPLAKELGGVQDDLIVLLFEGATVDAARKLAAARISGRAEYIIITGAPTHGQSTYLGITVDLTSEAEQGEHFTILRLHQEVEQLRQQVGDLQKQVNDLFEKGADSYKKPLFSLNTTLADVIQAVFAQHLEFKDLQEPSTEVRKKSKYRKFSRAKKSPLNTGELAPHTPPSVVDCPIDKSGKRQPERQREPQIES